MKTIAIVLFSAVCAGCSQPDTVGGQQSATAQERQEQVKTLSTATLREVLADDGLVAIVRVLNTSVSHPGTRGETIWIEAEVVEAVRGTASGAIRMRGFTSKRDSRLDDGRLYAVALLKDQGGTLLLTDFEDVPANGASDSADRHRRALAAIGGSAPR